MFLENNNKKQRESHLGKKKSAITLIELVIAIVVIGVLIAGVLSASRLIHGSKVSAARNLTKNSPVTRINNLFAWYETTLDNSLLDSESEEDSSLSKWKDIKSTSLTIDATQSNSNYQPRFSGKINDLDTIKFDGPGKYFNINATNLNNSDYTIMVVEKRSAANSNNYFIGDSSITASNENILLGYSNNDEVIHNQGSNSYTSSVSAYSGGAGDIRIFTFIQNSSSGKKTYINGYLAGQSSDTNPVSNLSNLVIGKNYSGEMGEVIIYNKSLSDIDRKDVEKYLSQKWSIKVNSASTSCTGGVVTSTGCSISCAVNLAGITSPSYVLANSSGSLTCETPEYNDTIPYNCSNDGVLDVGSNICDVCASGYSYYNSTCQGACSISGITGVTNGTSIAAGAGSVSCNSTGYAGSVSGICSNGTFTLNSGQTCNTCASGYSYYNSTCQGTCSISGITGVTNGTSITAGAGSVSCNSTGYTGSVSGICNNGTFTLNSGQACNTCASGYSYYNSTCQGPCSISSITGVTDGTSVTAGAGSVSCNTTGYTGSVSGVCNNGTFTLDSGQSCGCDTGYSLNGSGVCVVSSCTGGTTTTYTDGSGTSHKVHTFTTVGNSEKFQCPDNRNVDVLVVGGGGGGGVVYKTALSVTASTQYTITVGGGGAVGGNGSPSKFATTIIAQGGGAGGVYKGSGVAGGSGGGAGRDSNNAAAGSTTSNTTAGGTSYGNAGGKSISNAWSGGGGGGGAGSGGSTSNGGGTGGVNFCSEYGGAGGDGIQISISGITPTPYYGAGGGGATHAGKTFAKGGSYGYTGAGGNGMYTKYTAGCSTNAASNPTNGANGYGSGGGGGYDKAGTGGSGVVIISY